jgi:dienelactone hydrolase
MNFLRVMKVLPLACFNRADLPGRELVRLLSRPAGTLSSIPNGGEGRGEEVLGCRNGGNGSSTPVAQWAATILLTALVLPASAAGLPDLQKPPITLPANAPKLTPLLGAGAGAIITPAQWAKGRAEFQRAWTRFLGEFPREKAPLAPEFLKQEELPRFTRQLVTYQIEDGVRTDAMLLTPRGAGGKLPAIVLFHPTYSNHYARAVGLEGDDPERHQAVQLVERGYMVLAPRCFIWAELPAGYQRKGESLYVANVRRMQERHPQWKGMTRMTWDGIRALDFLETLPNVDTNRFGLFGHSLGAKEVVYVAAFDPRPRCVVSSEGGIGLRLSNWQDVWYLGPEIRAPDFAREHHELLALIAPRPFLLLAGGPGGGAADGDASWPFLEAARPVYRLLGAPENLGWLHHGLGHRYGAQARDAAEAFLDHKLKR